MSKSLGNIITVKSLLEDYHPDDFRLLSLLSHYRDQLDFSWEKLRMVAVDRVKLLNSIQQWDLFARGLSTDNICNPLKEEESCLLGELQDFSNETRQHLTNDFNWPKVFRPLIDGGSMVGSLRKYLQSKGSNAHPLLLSHGLNSIRSILSIAGLSQSSILDRSSHRDLLQNLQSFEPKYVQFLCCK